MVGCNARAQAFQRNRGSAATVMVVKGDFDSDLLKHAERCKEKYQGWANFHQYDMHYH
jgi:cell division FtsZ-interacting protein ZapD